MTRLFAISPGRGDLDRLLERLPVLARGGVEDFLLREKTLAAARREHLAAALAPRCRDWGLRLWISDDADLARRIGAEGVHLSERGGPPPADLPYGLSLHAGESRGEEDCRGAHHCFFGPVFSTPSKTGIVEPTGLDAFLCRERSLAGPLYALGGVLEDRLPELAVAGVRRVAGIRLFFGEATTERTLRDARWTLSEASPCP